MLLSDGNTVLRSLQQRSLSLLDHPAYTALLVPAEFASMQGMIRGNPITLYTRRFSGSIWRSVTVAWIVRASDEALCSLTLVGLPRPESTAPILGVDLICLNGSLSLIAVDLAPMDESSFSQVAAPRLVRLHQQTHTTVAQRQRPAFCHDTFSSLALICAAKPGHTAEVEHAVADFLTDVLDPGFADHFGRNSTDGSIKETWQRQRAWLRSEQANRKEANAMSLMFGDDLARRYLCGFLFEVSDV